MDANRAVITLEKRMVEITALLNKPAQGDRNVLSYYALVQYLDRIKRFDLSKFRDEILTPETLSAVLMGAMDVKAVGAKFKAQSGVIVTVV